nr:MAG TPA: hypothetical protein [Caudoviricetes sp.]
MQVGFNRGILLVQTNKFPPMICYKLENLKKL